MKYLCTNAGLYEADTSIRLVKPSEWAFMERMRWADSIWRILMDYKNKMKLWSLFFLHSACEVTSTSNISNLKDMDIVSSHSFKEITSVSSVEHSSLQTIMGSVNYVNLFFLYKSFKAHILNGCGGGEV